MVIKDEGMDDQRKGVHREERAYPRKSMVFSMKDGRIKQVYEGDS